MRIFTDYHHHALAESLELLAARFGWEVWFPAGMEWYDNDYWVFERKWHGDAVARQYLKGIWDQSDWRDDGTVLRRDPRHPDRVNHGITLDAALGQRWDIVLCSLPHDDEGYYRFAQETGARFGVQVGNNVQQSRWDLASFILSSSTLDGYGPSWAGMTFDYRGVPTVMYHQEFSLDIFYPEWPPANRREVASWVNCFGEGPSYPDFLRFARANGDAFDFKVYGALGSYAGDECQAGDISYVPDIADRMRSARVGWHSKHWSDGFGHTIHNWFAIGRPVVGYARYYADKIAGTLWQEGVTAFDIEGLGEGPLRALLLRLRDDDDYHRRICEASARRFREVVDFDAEAESIRRLLEA